MGTYLLILLKRVNGRQDLKIHTRPRQSQSTNTMMSWKQTRSSGNKQGRVETNKVKWKQTRSRENKQGRVETYKVEWKLTNCEPTHTYKLTKPEGIPCQGTNGNPSSSVLFYALVWSVVGWEQGSTHLDEGKIVSTECKK